MKKEITAAALAIFSTAGLVMGGRAIKAHNENEKAIHAVVGMAASTCAQSMTQNAIHKVVYDYFPKCEPVDVTLPNGTKAHIVFGQSFYSTDWSGKYFTDGNQPFSKRVTWAADKTVQATASIPMRKEPVVETVFFPRPPLL